MRKWFGVWAVLAALSACAPIDAPTPLGPVELQWAETPRDDAWRPAPSTTFAAEGDTLWLRVEVPATTVTDAAVQVRALFANDAWVCGRHFSLTGRLPILPLPCSPTQVLLRANANARLGTTTFVLGAEQDLWARVLRRDLAPFSIGLTMTLAGLLLLAAGLRSGAERAYRGLGLFLSSLGVLVALGTQLRHALPVSGTALFYAHEVATGLYPIGFADFLLGAFGDGPRRVLRRGLVVFALYLLAEWTLHFTGVVHVNDGRALTVLFIVVFLVQGLVLAFRARKTDPSARVFLAGIAALFTLSAPDILDGAGWKVLEFQTVPWAVLAFGVAMVVLIERQHRRAREEALANAKELAVKLAALEERNREINSLNTELRHQIAERSREMAEALQGGTAGLREARQLEPGDVVDSRYRVTRLLGRGAMGAVHAVERVSDGRAFAMKMMSGAVDTQGAARFAREAEIAARVSDEHLVKVVDVGGVGSGQLYLVMEYVEGRPLEDHRRRFGDVPWALAVLGQVASGVRALHAAGVVHRDLKPGNVLLTTREGRELAKISDFGISRRGATSAETATGSAAGVTSRDDGQASPPIASTLPPPTGLESTHVGASSLPLSPALDSTHVPPSSLPLVTPPEGVALASTLASLAPPPAVTGAPDVLPPALTVAGSLLGTPAYMAPELALGAQKSSPASDLFALGLIAYELLTGRHAFADPPLFIALAGRHLPKVAPLPDAVPRQVAEVVLQCLAEQPEARPTAETLVTALGRG